MNVVLEIFKRSNATILFVVYFSFLLDNMLLTVVVPIIPDFLFHKNCDSDSDSVIKNGTLILTHPKSLSSLQNKYESLEKSNFPLGALLASKSFVQLLVTPFVGKITNSVGHFIPLLVGSCNLTLASLLFAFGESYGMLIIARALHGIASSTINVSGMCLLAEKFTPEKRAKCMPIAFGGIATGVLLGYPFGGAAYYYLGKSAPFLLVALFLIGNIGIEYWILKGQTYQPTSEENRDYEGSNFRELLRHPSTTIIITCICIVTTAIAVLESCLPLWLLEKINPLSKWQLGVVFIPDSVGYFLAAHFGGILPVEAWRLALSGMVLAGLSCCGIPLANDLQQLIIPHLGLGIGVGLVDAALVPLLAKLVDVENNGNGHYGTVYALQQISVNLAYSFGPLLGGVAVRIIGFPKLMGLIGLLNIFICVFLVELEQLSYRKVTYLKI